MLIRSIIVAMKSERLEIVIPKWLKDAIREAAANKGITMSEYVKDTLKCAVITDSGTSRENKP